MSNFTTPMPGTMGGAEIIFKKDNMKNFTVSLDVKFVFDVDAETLDEAAENARYFFKTMKHSWGENTKSVSWQDHFITKQSVTEELDDEIA